MRLILACLVALSLAACSRPAAPARVPDTPLARAMLALKAGDYDAYVRAKNDAEAVSATAWPAHGDLCKVGQTDFQKIGEALLIAHFDHPDLFRLPDDQRFIYAVRIAGPYRAHILAASADQAPYNYLGGTGFGRAGPACRPPDAPFGIHMKVGPDGPPGEWERAAVLRTWQDELKARFGGAQYDHAMARAANSLSNFGYAADWPMPLDVQSTDAPH